MNGEFSDFSTGLIFTSAEYPSIWLPLQNGLFFDLSHRQSVTLFRISYCLHLLILSECRREPRESHARHGKGIWLLQLTSRIQAQLLLRWHCPELPVGRRAVACFFNCSVLCLWIFRLSDKFPCSPLPEYKTLREHRGVYCQLKSVQTYEWYPHPHNRDHSLRLGFR